MMHMAPRSALAIALACPMLAVSPALAFEPTGNEIADRFLAIVEAGNATVTVQDGVSEAGGAVTIKGLETLIKDKGNEAKLIVGTTVITDGVLPASGGLNADSMVMSGVTVDGKDGDETVRIEVKSISIDDPVMPSPETVKAAGSADGIAPSYSRAELTGIVIDANEQGLIPIASVVATIDEMDGDLPTSGSLAIEGVEISAASLDDEEKKTLTDLGYDKLTLSGSFAADWDPQSGKLLVSDLTVGGTEVGTLGASLAIGGLTREIVKKLDASQDNPEQAMALMQSLTLERLSMRLDNDSLVDRLLESQAKSSGVSRAEFVGQLTGALPMLLSVVNNVDFQKKIASAATTFLNEPKSFAAVAAPSTPLPFAQVMGTAMMAPQMLPDILNVTITANQPKAD
jgi:hypothetical protein